MSRKFIFITILLLVIFIPLLFKIFGYGEMTTNTTSDLKVISKGHSKDFKEYYIKVYDPNNQTKNMAFKIDIKDLTAWNLIEVNRDYIAAYDKTGNKNWFLKQIEHFQE